MIVIDYGYARNIIGIYYIDMRKKRSIPGSYDEAYIANNTLKSKNRSQLTNNIFKHISR